MTLILDTSVLINLENERVGTIEKLSSLRKIHVDRPKISFISYFEFIHGLRRKQPHNKYNSLLFIESFDVIQTTKTTAKILSLLKEKYGELSHSDLFIASQTIENGMILVTEDRDFEKIAELDKIIL